MSVKLVTTFFLLSLGGAALAADVRVVEEIVAKVNNDIVTRGDLEHTRQQIEAEVRRQGFTGAQFTQTMKEVDQNMLRDKIDELLLVQKGKDLSINVDGEISKRLAQIQSDVKIVDPEKFEAYIREQTGIPFQDFKQKMKDQMLIQRVIGSEVGSRITIPHADVQKYYDEHKNEFIREEQVVMREIFVSTQGKDGAGVAAAEKKAKELVGRARKGEKFGELARDNSDADTAKSYGELPPYKRADLRKEIADVVFKQGKGYVTDPIKQANGFLILKVDDIYKQGLQPFEVVENEIMEKFYMPKMEPARRTYLTRLRSEAFLQIRPGYVDTGAAPGKDTTWKDAATQLKPQTVTKEEVANRIRRKKAFWMVPVPGTKVQAKVSKTTKK